MTIKLKVRITKLGQKHTALILQDMAKGPHAHKAWKAVKTDLVEQLGMVHIESKGILAFGELSDTFLFGTGEVYLLHDTDSGDLRLTASDESTFSCVITKLNSLSSYDIQTNHLNEATSMSRTNVIEHPLNQRN